MDQVTFCTACGQELGPGVAFCWKCGTPAVGSLASAAPVGPAAYVAPEEVPSARVRRVRRLREREGAAYQARRAAFRRRNSMALTWTGAAALVLGTLGAFTAEWVTHQLASIGFAILGALLMIFARLGAR